MPINSKYQKDLVLHVDDERTWRALVEYRFKRKVYLQQQYGASFQFIELLGGETELDVKELELVIDTVHEPIKQGPVLISVDNGQLARAVMNEYIPGVMISDTGFPMNGALVVEWLIKHNLGSYPLIGLSGTSWNDLPEIMKKHFGMRNARYFEKSTYVTQELLEQIVAARVISERLYGYELKE